MEKLKLVGTLTMVCGLCFGNMYASSNRALLDEAEAVIGRGVEGLRVRWSPEAVRSFRDSVEQCREKLQNISLLASDEQVGLMEGELASLEEIIQDLDEFATTPGEEKKRYLRSIAYTVDSRVQSLILSRLDQIEKNQSGGQSEESGSEVDRSIPPTVFAESKAGPETVKSKNSKKSKKK